LFQKSLDTYYGTKKPFNQNFSRSESQNSDYFLESSISDLGSHTKILSVSDFEDLDLKSQNSLTFTGTTLDQSYEPSGKQLKIKKDCESDLCLKNILN